MKTDPADSALCIWSAGVARVQAGELVRAVIVADDTALTICDDRIPWSDFDRLVVLGAGKVAGQMAAAVEGVLGVVRTRERVVGWVNVPEGQQRLLERIHIHAARPAGVNEPTADGVYGSQQLMQLAGSLRPRDVCLVLLSGGASALLPLPHPDITLEDKLAVTRALSAAGADIVELNTVRKSLSMIKGGGLARAAHHGRMMTLVISDVIGDRLDIIASGPTVINSSTPADSLAILRRRFPDRSPIPGRVWTSLERRAVAETKPQNPFAIPVSHHIIGNNKVAMDAAVVRAKQSGFTIDAWYDVSGDANAFGVRLAEWIRTASTRRGPQCLIAGGETTVQLAPSAIRGRGGRNQQAALAALATLQNGPASPWSILVCGTDGEDGPTDAAGASIDQSTWTRVAAAKLDAAEALRRNDAWTFFGSIGQLVRTPSRDANVMDLAVAIVNADGSNSAQIETPPPEL